MKRLAAILLSLVFAVTLVPQAAAGATTTAAKPSPIVLKVDGKSTAAPTWRINGEDYFRLRDIALLLNGTEFKFSYESSGSSVSLNRGTNYTKNGRELAALPKTNKTATKLSGNIKVGSRTVTVPAYTINSESWFKLTALADIIGFFTSYDMAGKNLLLTTSPTFTNPFIESWTRTKLKMAKTEKFSWAKLDKVKFIGFSSNQELSDWDDSSNFSWGVMGFDIYDLNDIKNFRKLEQIKIESQQITDISPLACLTNLQSLNLTSNHVSDLSPLKNQKTLQYLGLDYNPVESIGTVKTLPALWGLSLADSRVTSLKQISGTNISMLDLDGTAITDLKNLKSYFPNLDSLSLIGAEYKDLRFVKDVKKLVGLQISRLTKADEAALNSLNINFLLLLDVTDASDFPALNIKSLKTLSIYNSDIDNLEFVKKCVNLEDLDIHGTKMSDISAVSALPKLTRVGLYGTDTRDVAPLKKLNKLNSVTIPQVAEVSYKTFRPVVSWKAEINGEQYGGAYVYDRKLVSANAQPAPTKFQAAAPEYISLSEAKAQDYDKTIITDKMLSAPTKLPVATNKLLPYWVGTYADSNKYTSIFFQGDMGFIREFTFELLEDNNENYLRLLYSFSRLHKPGDVNQIDESELKRLDELLSWSIKHNVHLQLSLIGLPGKWGTSSDEENIGSTGGAGYFSLPSEQKTVENLYSVLSARYKEIPNTYLSFELFAEPNYNISDDYDKNISNFRSVVESLSSIIWKSEGNKSDSDKRVLLIPGMIDTVEHTYDLGLAYSLSANYPHRLVVGSRLEGFYENYPYLPPVDEYPYYLMKTVSTGEDYALTINSENPLPKGTKVSVYIMADCANFELKADGKSILKQIDAKQWKRSLGNEYTVTLESAAKQLKLYNSSGIEDWDGWGCQFYQITVDIPGKQTVHLVPHSYALVNHMEDDNKNQVITIKSDLSVGSNRTIDEDWFYNVQLKPTMDVAEKYGVSFMIHEAGIMADSPLYYSVDESMFSVFRKYRIPFTAGCINEFLWHTTSITLGNFTEYRESGWHYDKKLLALVKKYTE